MFPFLISYEGCSTFSHAGGENMRHRIWQNQGNITKQIVKSISVHSCTIHCDILPQIWPHFDLPFSVFFWLVVTDINDCLPNPCQNGGTCVDGINTFSCICLQGFSGGTCATSKSFCLFYSVFFFSKSFMFKLSPNFCFALLQFLPYLPSSG